ncbi:hypothetical protein [Streptomyces sp. NPDC012510]|uniref:hypothetical protein n=1 Tax=Streptomyces sp. NPDC012510 TaxID=3364838 RepID=UPI0036E4CBA8
MRVVAAVATEFLDRVRRGRGPEGGGHLTVLRVGLRRGPGIWVAVLCGTTIPVCATLFVGHWNWQDDWRDTGMALSTSLTFALPVAVGVACRQGGAEARAGARWVREYSARGPFTHALLFCAPSVLWPLAGFALAVLVMFLAALWRTPASGVPPYLEVAYCAALLTAFTCLAHTVGALLPFRAVPVLAGFLCSLLSPLTGGAELGATQWAMPRIVHAVTPLRRYAGPTVPEHTWGLPSHRPDMGDYPALWPGWLMLTLMVALAATAVCVLARRWALPVVLCALLVPIAAAQPFDTTANRPVTAPFQVRCVRGSPTVCVSDDHLAVARRDAHTLAAHFGDRLAGVEGAPSHVLALRESYEACSSPDPAAAWTVEIDLAHSEENRFLHVADQLSNPACRWSERHWTNDDRHLMSAVSFWLLPAGLRDFTGDDEAVPRLTAHLSALPHHIRAAWLTRYLAAVRQDDHIPRLPPVPKAATP